MGNVVRRWWWLAAVGALIYAGAIFAMGEEREVPAEFAEARLEGGKLAAEIVAISAHSLENLKRIAAYDAAGNAPEALILISQEVLKNREMQARAITLSSKLERMAILIPQVDPPRARFLATEAVAAEVGLVGRLVTYTNDFYALFQLLTEKFEGRAENAEKRIAEFVAKINEEARAINGLNSKFTARLAEFDSIFVR